MMSGEGKMKDEELRGRDSRSIFSSASECTDILLTIYTMLNGFNN